MFPSKRVLPVVKTWVTSTVNREVAASSPAACGESRQRSSVGRAPHPVAGSPAKNCVGAFAHKTPVSHRLEKKEYVRFLEKYLGRTERLRFRRAAADDHRRRERLVAGRAGKALALDRPPDHHDDHRER